jgi:hypothetical protein
MAEHRERHARLTLHILDLLPNARVRADELVVFNTNPNDRDLRATVGVDRRQVGEGPTRDQVSHSIRNDDRISDRLTS